MSIAVLPCLCLWFEDDGRGLDLELRPARVADEEDVVAAAATGLDPLDAAAAGGDDLAALAPHAVDEDVALLDVGLVVHVADGLDAGDRVVAQARRTRRDVRDLLGLSRGLLGSDRGLGLADLTRSAERGELIVDPRELLL